LPPSSAEVKNTWNLIYNALYGPVLYSAQGQLHLYLAVMFAMLNRVSRSGEIKLDACSIRILSIRDNTEQNEIKGRPCFQHFISDFCSNKTPTYTRTHITFCYKRLDVAVNNFSFYFGSSHFEFLSSDTFCC
jgi:hypothetical protein